MKHLFLCLLLAACGGGGGDTYSEDTGMVIEYEPIPDQLIPVPYGFETNASFMVLIKGNLKQRE